MTFQESQKYLLETRRLTPASIREHNVAFCSRQGYLYAGTTYPKDFTQLENTYFNCLIFPIYDLFGAPVAIMSRRMYDSKNKYVNSATSNIFTKGRHLYGLDKSWPFILKENQAIVVEGIFDFIQLYQSGVKNVVCMMGTSLSETQLALISRFTTNVVVLPDPDRAGIRAGNKIKRKSEGRSVNCTFVQLPGKLDPDEMVINEGPDRLRDYIANFPR